MSIYASYPAREKRNDPQRARPQSTKSAWVKTICASALLTLSACGGSDYADQAASDGSAQTKDQNGNVTANADSDPSLAHYDHAGAKISGQATKGNGEISSFASNTPNRTASSAQGSSNAAMTAQSAPSSENDAVASQSTQGDDKATFSVQSAQGAGGSAVTTTQSAQGTVRTEKRVSTAAGPTGDYRPDGFDTLFFADEFDGNELDRSKWCTRFVWGGGPALQVPDDECTKHVGQGTLDYANIDEEQRYRDFNTLGEPLHVVNNGILQLRATKTGQDSYLQYEAAMLNSKMTFKPEGDQVYYITTRMKLPNVLGTWPSIWLAPSLDESGAAQWPPEIDIFEGPLNNNPETEYTLHQHSQVRGAQTDSGKYEFITYDENFETTWGYYTSPDRSLRDVWIEIAAKWDVNGVCFYIDGFNTACENYRWVGNDGAPGHPANLILNLAIGGPWAGRGGVDANKFPTLLEVDYVRVYRKN